MLTDEQKKARLGLITSSVAAAVLDMDDWSSQYEALLKIRGEYDFEGNDATERGNRLEPSLVTFAEDHSGMKAEPAPFKRGDAPDAGRGPWSGDSADGLLRDAEGKIRAVIEAKSVLVHGPSGWGEPETDDIPERVMVQAHWHMIHWPDAEMCYVPVIFSEGFVYRMYLVPRDAEFEDYIYAQAAGWHARHVVGDEPVPIGASKADHRALVQKSPRDWEGMIPADEKLEDLLERRITADAALKEAEKEVKRLSNLLRDAIGDHEGIEPTSAGVFATYRKNRDSSKTDWQAVARDLRASEEVIYRHTSLEPGARVLRVARRRAGAKKAAADAE